MAFTDQKTPVEWFKLQIVDVFGTENVQTFSTASGTLYAGKKVAPGKEILFSFSPLGSFIITLNNEHLVVARHTDGATMAQLKATLLALKTKDYDALQPTELAKQMRDAVARVTKN